MRGIVDSNFFRIKTIDWAIIMRGMMKGNDFE